MHRIDTPTAQKDKFGAGKNGFTAGNPQTGTPATDLDNDYFDMLQEELAGVVEATGAKLDKSRHDQLITAIHSLNKNRTLVVTSSQTVTIPDWLTEIYVTASAGGGGGGGSGGSTNLTGTGAGGQGGGAGEFVVKRKFAVTPGSTINVTIGAGGTGGIAGTPSINGGNGTAGGGTVIGSLLTLNGGGGGHGGDSFMGSGLPGGGAGGTGHPAGQDGQDGANTILGNGCGGNGGNSFFGGGAGGSR
ncbi:glycine-rich domain-containing protein, partial [Citrobacter braakii]|uniref:glycine-rich domain-containing protein n=2 Tax=Enterobacteriaceae TaxID=543 RepID=UPI0037C8A0CD